MLGMRNMNKTVERCGKCIHYRRSKKGFKNLEDRHQLAIEGFSAFKKPPRWYGACSKNNWYVSAMMRPLGDCGFETAYDLTIQWRKP